MSLRLFAAILALTLPLLVLASIISSGTASAQDAAAEATPSPAPTAPTVTITSVVPVDSVEHDKHIVILTTINNGSSNQLTNVRIGSPSSAFTASSAESRGKPLAKIADENIWILGDIPGLDSPAVEIDLAPGRDARFGDHRLPISVAYDWVDAQSVTHSIEQLSTVDVKVERRFESEIGTVSGGAAVLYFLLPALLFFIAFRWAYQIVGGISQLTLPNENLHTLPIIIIAALLGYLVLDEFGYKYTGDFPDRSQVYWLVGAASVGAAVALVVRLGFGGINWVLLNRRGVRRFWCFQQGDSMESVLKKAYHRPWPLKWLDPVREPLDWVYVTSGGQNYGGILLEKGADYFVLGRGLHVKPKDTDMTIDHFRAKVLTEEGVLLDEKKFAKMVAENKLSVSKGRPIRAGECKPSNHATFLVKGTYTKRESPDDLDKADRGRGVFVVAE